MTTVAIGLSIENCSEHSATSCPNSPTKRRGDPFGDENLPLEKRVRRVQV